MIIERVYDVIYQLMRNSKHVKIDEDSIIEFSKFLYHMNPPGPFVIETDFNEIEKVVLLELFASSINFCYWYGKFDVRPSGSSCTLLYDILFDSFSDYSFGSPFEDRISKFVDSLIYYRFPLVNERIKHLKEISDNGSIEFVTDLCSGFKKPISYWYMEMLRRFPNFASDIFLKRASLFFIQLYRRFGWFKDQMDEIVIPADYHIPKLLQYLGCITYSFPLFKKIRDEDLILSGSLEECEIRAATIYSSWRICEESGWNIADLDTYLFSQRHEVKDPFHLTVTTDY